MGKKVTRTEKMIIGWIAVHIKLLIVSLIMFADSRISFSLMTSGGAKRIIWPCVFFAKSPLSFNRRQTFHASTSATERSYL